MFAAVGRGEIENRADWDDSSWIDVVVRHVIVAFDLIEVDGIGDPVDLVEVAQISIKVRIVDYAPKIALEVAVVDGIEAHERYEEAPIRF